MLRSSESEALVGCVTLYTLELIMLTKLVLLLFLVLYGVELIPLYLILLILDAIL